MSKKGRVSFRVTCPATEQICTVGVQLKGTKGALRGRSLAHRDRRPPGRAHHDGHPDPVEGPKLAVRRHPVAAQLVLTVRDGSGNRAITRTAMTARR